MLYGPFLKEYKSQGNINQLVIGSKCDTGYYRTVYVRIFVLHISVKKRNYFCLKVKDNNYALCWKILLDLCKNNQP